MDVCRGGHDAVVVVDGIREDGCYFGRMRDFGEDVEGLGDLS